MSRHYPIKYLTNKEIDQQKWDRCIAGAKNGVIYGYSYYLNQMAIHWDGLVFGDYDAVMPLTWNKKYGIAYLYQPFLAAQLGVFGNDLSSDLLRSFFDAVPSRFRHWDIYLNHHNLLPVENYPLYIRKNFVLPLNQSYEQLYNAYRENTQRNIKKSKQFGCRAIKDIEADRVIELAVAQMRHYTKESTDNIERFKMLYDQLHQRKQAICYGILSAKDILIASCIFFFSHNRAYYILVGNHPDGRTLGASHALIDAFIQDHAGRDLLLDFEGSDVRNLAFFYSSFGAVEENYSALRLNRLPFYLRWAKKE
ncbi:GNAT family N-acetyltransferase [Terrimonas sp. NA20]|uniref:GNAT family N-acetyltransferase n=1 Tax=Terrimonas ginsenosidimutans TaxID=2908004 RepID=A0ABS9KU33_9BACT|nr:GNAT family N-acetyltransferase [Terrimonas ginsenosidimutans]MCG2615793.1 GNAT family N-acetyltransferase [Terrimonas ginsenosidimutans]